MRRHRDPAAPHGRAAFAAALALPAAVLAFAIAAGPARAQVERDPAQIVGPGECTECHENAGKIWQHTTHHATFREMPRKKKAIKMARRMGERRIKKASLCTDCHFTMQKQDDGEVEAIAGISCESCHGAGKDYLELHSNFSGKTEEKETAKEERIRWRKSEKAGMIRPKMMYTWAKNCLSCHIVPKEKLVNKGGHPAGSDFELVAWSQGEVRHNVWYNDGKANPTADKNKQRKMFVVGMAVELETAMRAVGNATTKADYAVSMAKRVARGRKRFAQATKLIGDVPEMKKITKIAQSAQLKLNNKKSLTKKADRIGELTQKIVENYDGSAFSAIDPALPSKDGYKGSPKPTMQ